MGLSATFLSVGLGLPPAGSGLLSAPPAVGPIITGVRIKIANIYQKTKVPLMLSLVALATPPAGVLRKFMLASISPFSIKFIHYVITYILSNIIKNH